MGGYYAQLQDIALHLWSGYKDSIATRLLSYANTL